MPDHSGIKQETESQPRKIHRYVETRQCTAELKVGRRNKIGEFENSS